MRNSTFATCVALAASVLASPHAYAQNPRVTLAADLETRPSALLLESRVFSIHGVNISALDDRTQGTELWSFGLAGQNPKLLKDIAPLWRSSSPRYLAQYGGHAYFVADDGARGFELWRTDGTSAGTSLAIDLNKGPFAGSEIYDPVVYKNELYFVADDGVHGRELWAWNGTRARLVVDLFPGREHAFYGVSLNTSEAHMIAAHGLLWFEARANLTGSGFELYVSDGTAQGTRMVADLMPQPFGRVQFLHEAANGRVLFGVQNASSSLLRLVSSDGTQQGTRILHDDVMLAPHGFAQRVLFTRYLQNQVTTWVSDGSASQQLPRSVSGGKASVQVGSRVVYEGFGGVWVSDGTPSGTKLAVAGAGLLGAARSGVLVRTAAGVEAYDPARDARVTLPIGEAEHYGTGLASVAWLRDDDNAHWVSDGSLAGTSKIAPFPSPYNLGSTPRAVAAYGDTALFTSAVAGADTLHTVDRRLQANTVGAWEHGLHTLQKPALFRGRLWASGRDATRGIELASFDPVSLQRLSIYDNTPGLSFDPIVRMIPAGRLLFYMQEYRQMRGSAGLWVTNGEARGNRPLFTVPPPTDTPALPWGEKLLLGGVARLHSHDGVRQTELWRGPVIYTAPVASRGQDFVFMTVETSGRHALRISDGTQAGTRTLVSYSGTFAPRFGRERAVVLDDTYVIATHEAVFASRGTSASTARLVPTSTDIQSLVRLHAGLAAFVATTPSGTSLYVTDGTLAGTRSVKTWSRGTRIEQLASHGRRWLSFVVNNVLVLSDGKTVHPLLTKVAAPLVDQQGEHLVFFAEDSTRGVEPHVMLGLGAMLQEIGEGCGRATRIMKLDSTPPTLGTTVQLDLRGGPGSGVALLGLGAPTLRSVVGPDACMLHFDAMRPITIVPVAMQSGRARRAVALPNDPRLRGLDLALQAVAFGAQGFEASNGLVWYFD